MSRILRTGRDALTSLKEGGSRTLLMILGVATGVAVLSAVIITAQGTRERVMKLVKKHSLDMIMVRAGGEVQVFAPRADRGLAVLFEEDARAIESSVPGVIMVSVVQNARGINATFQDRVVTTRIFGVEPDWMEIRHWGVADGDFFSPDDYATTARTAILGAHVARQLFPTGGAVGNTIRIANDPFVVKGVFIEMGASAGGDDWDDRIVLPFTTTSRRVFGRPYLEQIVLRASDLNSVAPIAEKVRALLRVRHSISAGEGDDFFVREPEDVEGAALSTSSTLFTMLLVVSVIALLASGTVIMNLMLLAVSRRSHEIGVRRAVGAKASDVSALFLLESTLVALAGCTLGVATGLLAAVVLSATGLADIRITWLPFAIALAACSLIGLAFGAIPAAKAARVDPVTTLRQRAL